MTTPGRPAAISRMSCESTPCGNEYDSISFASTSAPRRGSLPMLLPMVRRMSPGRPSCEKPRSAKSPMPTTRTVVRSRGRPSRGEDRRQLVDEALRQRVPGARAADHHGAAVADEPDRLADVDDLGHGM